MSLQQNFERKFDCEIEEKSDLAPIKEAENCGNLSELKNAISLVQGDHSKEKTVKSGLWIFWITWNEDLGKVQISSYGYRAGIIYKEERPDNE